MIKKLCVFVGIMFATSNSLSAETIEKVMYWADSNGVVLDKSQVTIINGDFIRWTATNAPPTQVQLDGITQASVDSWVADSRPTRFFEQTFTNRFAAMQGYMGTNLTISIPFAYGDSLVMENELNYYVIEVANASQARAVNALATSLLFLWNRISAIDPLAMYAPYFGQ